LKRKFLNRK